MKLTLDLMRQRNYTIFRLRGAEALTGAMPDEKRQVFLDCLDAALKKLGAKTLEEHKKEGSPVKKKRRRYGRNNV